MVYSEVQALDKLAEQILVSKWAFKGEKFIRLSSLQDHRHSSKWESFLTWLSVLSVGVVM